MGKVGLHLPRTLSNALSFGRTSSSNPNDSGPSFHVPNYGTTNGDADARAYRSAGYSRSLNDLLPSTMVRIGRSLIRSGTTTPTASRPPSVCRPANPPPSVPMGAVVATGTSRQNGEERDAFDERVIPGRTIRFHDEQHAVATDPNKSVNQEE